ncbi:MAG: nickel-dependent lactate racemase [Candidatus Bathyarchaeota archaeon]
MVEIWLPYGKTEAPVKLPDENLIGIIDSKEIPAAEKPQEEIVRALNTPIASETLEKLVKPENKVAIVLDDIFFPSKLVFPLLIEKLINLGIKESDITILLGCNIQNIEAGYKMLTEEIINKVKVTKGSMGTDEFIQVGETSRGTKIQINKIFLDADLRILTGRVGFHPYSGYSGGRDGVLPAICGAETIRRSNALILEPRSKMGYLEGNQLNQEMEEAAQMAKVNFTVNVVLNSGGEVVKAFAGDLDQAFLEGVKFLDERFKISVERAADVVILSSGGHPWDITLDRACTGLASALNIVKDGGVIIWVAESPEGYGNNVFYDWMTRFRTSDEVALEIKRKPIIGGELAYLLLRALERVKIILVSILPDYYSMGIFRLRTAKTINIALNSAYRILGRKGKILVLPHGNTVLPMIKKE